MYVFWPVTLPWPRVLPSCSLGTAVRHARRWACSGLGASSLTILSTWNAPPPDVPVAHSLISLNVLQCHLIWETIPDHLSLSVLCSTSRDIIPCHIFVCHCLLPWLFPKPKKVLCWVCSLLHSPAIIISWQMNGWLIQYLVMFPNIYILMPFFSSLMSGRFVWCPCDFFAWETVSSFIYLTEIQVHLWFDIILYVNIYLSYSPTRGFWLQILFWFIFAARTLHVYMPATVLLE